MPLEELRPLDGPEHGLIAKLNDERRRMRGPDGRALRRLRVSAALTQAASDYAEYMRATGRFDHSADGRTAADRAREAGWNQPSGMGLAVGEDLFEGASPEVAYSSWKRSPTHNAVLFHPEAHWIGVGRSADKWVLLVGGRCAARRCGRAAEREGPGAIATAAPRATHLRFRIETRGRMARVGVRVLRGEGRVLVRLRGADGHSARRLRLTRRGNLWRFAFRLPRAGTWRATIRFRAERGWTDEVARPGPFAVR